MKKILIILIITAAASLIYLRDGTSVNTSGNSYTGNSVRLAFNYPDGYVVTEKPTSVILMTEEDYQSVESGEREGGEGPPAIVIAQYDNPNNPGPQQWAEQYPQLSNYNLRTGEVKAVKVAGYEGIRYDADGLYPSHNVVFADDVRVYYLNGQYLDRASALYRDFNTIVDSIKVR